MISIVNCLNLIKFVALESRNPRGTVYFASWNSLFFIDSVIFRRSALSGLYATSTRIIRVLFWKKIMCCLRPKIKIMKLPWNQTFPKRVKICQIFDFPGRNKQFPRWFIDVPDRSWGRGSTGVLWLGANWIPINCSIFWKNGTVSLANSHTFVEINQPKQPCNSCVARGDN